MEISTLKIKISMLWLFTEFAFFHPLYFIEPGVIEGILAGEVEGMPIGPEIIAIFRNYVFGSIGDGLSVPDPKGFDKSLGKYHRGHSLRRSWPH